MRDKADKHGHMLFSDSARLAKEGQAKLLWLTHYSPSIDSPEKHLPTAREIFENTETAHDGMRITL